MSTGKIITLILTGALLLILHTIQKMGNLLSFAQLILSVVFVGLLGYLSGAKLADPVLGPSLPRRERKERWASLTLSFLVLGAVLSPLPILGLMGLPLLIVGALLALFFSLQLDSDQPIPMKEVAGIILIFLGIALLAVGALSTSISLAEILLAWDRGKEAPWRLFQWLILLSWILAPSLIALGFKWRRSGSEGSGRNLWFYWFSPFPLTVIGLAIGHWLGNWPLST